MDRNRFSSHLFLLIPQIIALIAKKFELCSWICAYDKDTKPRTKPRTKSRTKPRHSARSRRIQEVNECLREHMYTY